jgi:hypothetical protein
MNEKIKMNIEILNVICAVLDYKRFICSNNMVYLENDFDWYEETKKYYNLLPLPEGMKTNNDDFVRALSYMNREDELLTLQNTDYEELGQYYWKG